MGSGKRRGCAQFVLVAFFVASCGGAALPPPQPLHVPPPSAAAPPLKEPREIHPGVLRGLMIDGELRVAFDGLVPTDTLDQLNMMVVVRVCLDRDGNASPDVVIPGRSDAYRQAALAALATWRFRPYTLDGAPLAVCAYARFIESREFPDLAEALPPARVELPRPVERAVAFPRGLLSRAPTPGVALARVCRKQGSRGAPTFTLLQSSGDAAFDRSLFEVRATVPVDEVQGPAEHCWLRSGLAHVPDDPFDFDKEPASDSVKPAELEVSRISGDRSIIPSDRVKGDIAATGETQLMVPVKVCVAPDGRPYSVKLMKSSGHFAYDMDIINGVASWRYKSLAKPTCSAIQFIYRQRSASPRRRR
jgi:hypothetical protein